MKNITVVGRLGRDPESRQLDGRTMTKFSVAVSDYKKNTTWFNVTVFGKQADSCAQYLNKGSQVVVAGRFETFEGEKGTQLCINANDVQFVGARQDNDPF